MPQDHAYNENELLLRIAERDASVYPYLHDTYYNSLVYFSLGIIHNQQQAEDIAVESLVKAWQTPTGFESVAKLKSYLFTLVKNASLNYLKHLRVKEKSLQLSEFPEPVDAKLEALIIEADLVQLIYKEIERLPQTHREVLQLLYLQDLPPAEAAGRLGITMDNLRQRKGRALKELKSELMKKGIDKLISLLIFF